MKRFAVLAVMLAVPFVAAQETRTFFPQDSIRGYLSFEVAPPHNEPDLGFCNATILSTRCGAFARYVWGGYIELQPFGIPTLRRFFLFADPKMYGGDNQPQVDYTASAYPIAWERTYGFGVELPKHLELRMTHHDTQLLGKYAGPNNVANLSRNGPLGLYTTVGVRWYFGKYGRRDIHE